METSLKCSVPGCEIDDDFNGLSVPVFCLRKLKSDEPVKAVMTEMPRCSSHRDVKVEDILTDQAWRRLTKSLREAGAGTFKQHMTTLEWRTP
jgi:hypothetical protein